MKAVKLENMSAPTDDRAIALIAKYNAGTPLSGKETTYMQRRVNYDDLLEAVGGDMALFEKVKNDLKIHHEGGKLHTALKNIYEEGQEMSKSDDPKVREDGEYKMQVAANIGVSFAPNPSNVVHTF